MAQQQQQQLHLLSGIPAEALLLLEQELNAQQPSVARASIIMGLLQERLFGNNCEEPLAPAVELYMAKFQAELVAPAAAKLAPKLKKPQVSSLLGFTHTYTCWQWVAAILLQCRLHVWQHVCVGWVRVLPNDLEVWSSKARCLPAATLPALLDWPAGQGHRHCQVSAWQACQGSSSQAAIAHPGVLG